MKVVLKNVMFSILILSGMSLGSSSLVQAQAPAKVNWHVIASGGAINVASGQYRTSSTIGQPVVGTVSVNPYKMYIGFWGFAGLTSGTTGVDDNTGTMGSNPLLFNYPNPFAYQTTINFIVEQSATVSIKIYDMVGREVRTLVSNEFREIGDHMVTWDAKDDSGADLGAGNYICEMSLTSAGDNMKSRIPMMLVK
jgi:FlgD Ig-like domain